MEPQVITTSILEWNDLIASDGIFYRKESMGIGPIPDKNTREMCFVITLVKEEIVRLMTLEPSKFNRVSKDLLFELKRVVQSTLKNGQNCHLGTATG